jgi:heme/copper-type cytochrome/quinol oxidase subunit 3
MSPVDARRVILIDGQTDTSESIAGEMRFGYYLFLVSIFAIFALLGWTAFMTRRKSMKDDLIVDDSRPNLSVNEDVN